MIRLTQEQRLQIVQTYCSVNKGSVRDTYRGLRQISVNRISQQNR